MNLVSQNCRFDINLYSFNLIQSLIYLKYFRDIVENREISERQQFCNIFDSAHKL